MIDGSAPGRSPLWGWFGEQSDVEEEVSRRPWPPSPRTPAVPTVHSAHTLAPHRGSLLPDALWRGTGTAANFMEEKGSRMVQQVHFPHFSVSLETVL